jgi:hypothetical protein
MGPVPFWLFFGISMMMMPLFGFVGSNFNSIAMEPLGAIAGTASSTLGFAQTVGGGLVGALIGQAYDGTVFPLAAGYALVSAVSLVMVLIAEKGRLFGVGDAGCALMACPPGSGRPPQAPRAAPASCRCRWSHSTPPSRCSGDRRCRRDGGYSRPPPLVIRLPARWSQGISLL